MADIIPLRSAQPARAVPAQPMVFDPADAWLMPLNMLRLGFATWASLWLAPMGLRVETVEKTRPSR
ncbi:MAG TPA: hypothetical protein VNS22_24890 [Geminicoccus sp.]|uniref:hypothetical protein n=1 Tax=Geminicoccus sp. TaxID=2024832 RepID=UPI002B8E1EDF|nr:hypothetical protein [Geminicoccus sp.]HWL71595.1 hypothetical protein [Geminicoccus sp.]